MKIRSLVAVSTIIGLLVVTACSPSAPEAERAAAEASQSEVVTESTEPTESTDFGQDGGVVVGSDYMDPISANSWVEIKNRSKWTVAIDAFDYDSLSHEQRVVLKPGEELDLWGWGSLAGKDVAADFTWCLDLEQQPVAGRCPGSTLVWASSNFERGIMYGSYVQFRSLKEPTRPSLQQGSEKVSGLGKGQHTDSTIHTESASLNREESRVFVPYPDFPDLDSIQFYVSRRQDKSGVLDRKITRFWVIIEDLGSRPSQ